MPKKTYVIRDADGRYYRSYGENFFTTAYSKILVIETYDLSLARKFRSLFWATHRAKFLSLNGDNYYYVYEVIIGEPEPLLQIRNKDAIDKIRKTDLETIAEIKRIVEERKGEHDPD